MGDEVRQQVLVHFLQCTQRLLAAAASQELPTTAESPTPKSPPTSHLDDGNEALQDFLKSLKAVFEFRMRPRAKGFSLFPGLQKSGVWDFIYETLSKRKDSQTVLSSVIDSSTSSRLGSSSDLEIQFFKYCLMQQTLGTWVKALVSDTVSVASFYEPPALIRRDADATVICEELNKLSTCEFYFVLKTDSTFHTPLNLQSLSTITATAATSASAIANIGFQSLSVAKDGIGSLGKAASARTFALYNAATKSGANVIASTTSKSSGSLASASSKSSGSSPQLTEPADVSVEELSAGDVKLKEVTAQLEAEKKERLALQVQLVSVQHARDIEISNLQSQLLRQTRMMDQMKENHKKEIDTLRMQLTMLKAQKQ
ncbi:hypothetical protein HDV05_006223 [Chytridiales sp. JEL 0842]|nr:hypothetical protein HDV05_006223 [Chytridiales sp. JEL 0842]